MSLQRGQLGQLEPAGRHGPRGRLDRRGTREAGCKASDFTIADTVENQTIAAKARRRRAGERRDDLDGRHRRKPGRLQGRLDLARTLELAGRLRREGAGARARSLLAVAVGWTTGKDCIGPMWGRFNSSAAKRVAIAATLLIALAVAAAVAIAAAGPADPVISRGAGEPDQRDERFVHASAHPRRAAPISAVSTRAHGRVHDADDEDLLGARRRAATRSRSRPSTTRARRATPSPTHGSSISRHRR